MRLAVWPADPARALGRALAGAVAEVVEVAPWEAAAALAEGRCDLALVPTLEVLRAPQAVDLVPGVALAGAASPTGALVVGAPLDAVRTLAFDPRLAQEALLAAVLLREHYGTKPAFAAADPAAPLADRLAGRDAVLTMLPVEGPLPEGALVLDLGQEWLDLTTRPFVWGLLAARAGELTGAAARALAEAARSAPPDAAPGFQLTLDGYAHEGLEEFERHLFYHGALADLPDLPFVAAGPPPDDVATTN